tara:strand:+ start:239 stop:859 length:621 start_codon:yes stop_codon:yes gene_type:complete
MITRKDSYIFHLLSLTLKHYGNVIRKYEIIAKRKGTSEIQEMDNGIADLLKGNSILFYSFIDGVDFNGGDYLDSMSKFYMHVVNHFEEENAVNENFDTSDIKSELIPYQWDIVEYFILNHLREWHITSSDRITELTEMDKEFFSMDEAVKATGYKKSYLYKLKSNGSLRAYQNKPGAKITFKKEDLEQLLTKAPSLTIDDFIMDSY